MSWFVEMEDPEADRKQAGLCYGEFNEKDFIKLYEAEIQHKVAQRAKQNKHTAANKTEGKYTENIKTFNEPVKCWFISWGK